MQKEYEYDGDMIVMHSPTVGSAYARKNILSKLRLAMGYQPGDLVPLELVDSMYEFAEICARTQVNGSDWWVSQMDTIERVKAGYAAFLALDVEFVEIARVEANAMLPPKKTTPNKSKTSRKSKTS